MILSFLFLCDILLSCVHHVQFCFPCLVSQTSAVFPSSLPRFPFCVNIVSVFSCLLSIYIILPAVCSVSLVFPSLISKCLHGFVMSICDSCNKAAFESCIILDLSCLTSHSFHDSFLCVNLYEKLRETKYMNYKHLSLLEDHTL